MHGRRLVAIMLSMLAALALSVAASAPAAAQSTASYRAELNQLTLDMRALWGEIERFTVKPRYCLPPGTPMRAPDQAALDALEGRVTALNARYNRTKQGLKDFLTTNTRLHGELMANGVDPRDHRWWTRYDTSRDKMVNELRVKKAALALKREMNCSPPPPPKPAIAVSPPTPLPLRPAIDPIVWPGLPPHFCTEAERWKFLVEQINPLYLREAENAEKAAKFRTQVEIQVNNLVQADKPIPPALAALRRQAIADVAEQDREAKKAQGIYRRVKNEIPVVDCRTPTQTGSVTAPPAGSAAARILEVHNRERGAVGSAPLRWDPQLAASASAYAAKLAAGGPFVHAPRTGRENERENLSRGLPGASLERMMANWTNEKGNFIPGTYPNVSKTGSWYDVSHYTQMIWPTTTNVGCGTARGAGQEVLVCRYTPPGNRDGRQVLADNSKLGVPDLGKMQVGGGMQQIDPPAPPPPPRPTAADPAPDGNEARHPLASLFARALNRHYEALRKCDVAAARRALDDMRYALDELRERLKAARSAGGFSTVNPDELQRLIDGLERVLRGAEQRGSPGTCPPR